MMPITRTMPAGRHERSRPQPYRPPPPLELTGRHFILIERAAISQCNYPNLRASHRWPENCYGPCVDQPARARHWCPGLARRESPQRYVPVACPRPIDKRI
jgi:hypothetical protein